MIGVRDLMYMGRDFFQIVRGRHYFHHPQALGGYFRDKRCYYNDFQGKVAWKGECINGLPALYVPAWDEHVTFPIMVMQYGLGSIDRYYLQGDESCLANISRVTSWLLSNLNSSFHYENYFPRLDPSHEYYSGNSAMAQGQALSFLVRARAYHWQDADLRARIDVSVRGIFRNMIKPLEENGTALVRDGDVYFCELCRKDGCVVLNGWIFTIFGLLDYYRWSQDREAGEYLEATLQTLKKDLPLYFLPDGWMYYNNRGRICSPHYQFAQIYLFEALHRLTGDSVFERARRRSQEAYSVLNRTWYTIIKVKEKLSDRMAYTTQV